MEGSLCGNFQALDIAANDEYFAAVDRLALWLKQNAQQNVLMPVSVHRTPNGDSLKAPARAHKGGAHTWDHYDAYRQRVLAPGQPIGILMRNLICVDIDDASLVPVWEAKYPCLLSSARETTRKGTHYIFRRSPKCDAIALTNGARQFQDDAGDDLPVDICSITRSECNAIKTAGLLVVTPSPNKQWKVAPWEIDLPPIPDSFVEALEKMRERKQYKKKKGDPRECDPDRLAAIANDQALRDAGIDPDVLACLYMLSPQRAEEYNSWLGVGFTLKACGLQYEPLWHDWSRLSDKYDPAVASSKWASFPSDSQPAPKDWLRRAARSDSPDAYTIFAKSSTEDAIFQSVLQEGSHVSVAQVFRSLFPDTYVWLGINKGHYYYHFNGVKWMEFDDPAPIKNLLTTELVPLFEKAAEAAEEQWTSNKKDKDADPPPTVTVPRSIARRLGDCSFRNSVCTEIATLYFDATLSFFDRLDADHNLLAFDDGVFDLSTKSFRPTRPDDHITRTTGYSYHGPVTEPDPADVARLGFLLTRIFPDIETRRYIVAQTSQWLNGRTGKHLWHLLTGGPSPPISKSPFSPSSGLFKSHNHPAIPVYTCADASRSF
ncbi:hypothetical protein CVIRNUC_003609 [Coccomyxa viridis]|uniref:Bacteriophage/plasmid primase P4 C-terminal domain-containing protein n=1 Tax=Coccomyxa viridis TaxID=1274662 RepID=A0AAV1HZ29_9CHLO|nr:hypothetical protein CVIRNUC_003609 [Coccomyxa viridis]